MQHTYRLFLFAEMKVSSLVLCIVNAKGARVAYTNWSACEMLPVYIIISTGVHSNYFCGTIIRECAACAAK